MPTSRDHHTDNLHNNHDFFQLPSHERHFSGRLLRRWDRCWQGLLLATTGRSIVALAQRKTLNRRSCRSRTSALHFGWHERAGHVLATWRSIVALAPIKSSRGSTSALHCFGCPERDGHRKSIAVTSGGDFCSCYFSLPGNSGSCRCNAVTVVGLGTV